MYLGTQPQQYSLAWFEIIGVSTFSGMRRDSARSRPRTRFQCMYSTCAADSRPLSQLESTVHADAVSDKRLEGTSYWYFVDTK